MDIVSRIYRQQMTCVYRLYDVAGRLLYVGVAYDFDVRFKQHAKDKEWWPLVARKDVIWFDNRFDAMYEEARAIAEESPIHNDRQGIHPVGLAVVWRRPYVREDYAAPDGELVVSAYGKRRILREVECRNVHALLAVEGVPKGVIVPVDFLARACARMGVPFDLENAPAIDVEDL